MGFQPVIFSLFSLFSLICVGCAMDQVVITSIHVTVGNGWKNGTEQIACTSTKLTIEGAEPYSQCDSDGTGTFRFYNGSAIVSGKDNITMLLEVAKKGTSPSSASTTVVTTVVTNYTGVFIPDKSNANKVLWMTVNLDEDKKPAAAPKSNADAVPSVQGHLLISYMYQQFEDKCKEAVKTKNGGAVAVAIIEGIALIAILAYFGYKTMVDRKKQQMAMASSYGGYDSNGGSRITVPDTIRMSDIPPPRDPNYASPPTVSRLQVQPQLQQAAPPTRSSAMTSPELVVPQASSQGAGTFNDPFASLESW